MIHATEGSFARHVLRAALPALVCFGTRACPGRRAMLPTLEAVAAEHAGRLLVADVLLDGAPLLAEQYGLFASPTLAVFLHGDRQGQAVGFIADGLVRLLAAEAAEGAVCGDRFWSPVEERFEDVVLLPMLARWGLAAERQVPCALPGRGPALRGRVDLLVREGPGGPPLTLIESKRQIRGEPELQQAARQAAGYAASLGLPSSVVAAPRGVWVFRHAGGRPGLVHHWTSLELHHEPERLPLLLRQLRDAATGP